MADGARSDNPAVQHQLDRLTALSPGRDVLGLDRIQAVLDRLDNPQDRLPPVFHVAGTNGKGSTCAFLRAAIEAEGLTAHVYSSPHLVRFNERIRVAGKLIDDNFLADLLAQVLDRGEEINPSFFEATTAAALLAFAEIPADACILEVGLGGRLDATNIVGKPAATGIAALGIDHEAFLLSPESGAPADPMVRIAWEKAGIAKNGVPLVTQKYSDDMTCEIARHAASVGAVHIARGDAWDSAVYEGNLHYRDAQGKLSLPLPILSGSHQAENAALAVAMLRHQETVTISESAFRAAMGWAKWPARLQLLSPGPLTNLLPDNCQCWLDGGHNPSAGTAIGAYFADLPDHALHLVIGMLSNKNPNAIIEPLAAKLASITVVPVFGHDAHGPEAFSTAGIAVSQADDVMTAIGAMPHSSNPPQAVLIAGSLYLAGDVLRFNQQIPD